MDSFVNQVTSSDNEEQDACLDAELFCNSHVFHRVLGAAIELDLFSIIARAGPSAQVLASEIASQLPTQNPDAASMLDRMLSMFVSHSLLTCSFRTLEDGTVNRLYGLTPASRYFIRDNNNGACLSDAVALNCYPAAAEVWRHVKDLVLEGGGGNLFKKVHGMSYFEYINKDPVFSNIFNRSMAARSVMVMSEILKIYKGFEGLSLLVDVGGGTGKSLQLIISKYPSMEGINFDLPHVIQTAPSYRAIEHVGGDALSGVPIGDAIMLKDVCHNWNDENCLKILKSCCKALPNSGKVIIINAVLPAEPNTSKASMHVSRLDMSMLMIFAGQERTTKQFDSLCKKAGFSNFQVACVAHHVWAVMEAFK